jgi:hypothetical protein
MKTAAWILTVIGIILLGVTIFLAIKLNKEKKKNSPDKKNTPPPPPSDLTTDISKYLPPVDPNNRASLQPTSGYRFCDDAGNVVQYNYYLNDNNQWVRSKICKQVSK